MAIEHKRPNLVRRINLMANTVGGAEYLVSLDPDDMLNVAQRTTGLADFGERLTGDDSWREAYYKMVECFDQQGDLNTLGRLMTRQEFIRFLRTRLMVVNAHLQNPSIREIAIEKPLFIVGNSRTGTTILHELLASTLNCARHWHGRRCTLLTLPTPPYRAPNGANVNKTFGPTSCPSLPQSMNTAHTFQWNA